MEKTIVKSEAYQAMAEHERIIDAIYNQLTEEMKEKMIPAIQLTTQWVSGKPDKDYFIEFLKEHLPAHLVLYVWGTGLEEIENPPLPKREMEKINKKLDKAISEIY